MYLVRHRPSGAQAAPVLATSHLSRAQLKIRAMGETELQVVNVGMCPLFQGGQQTAEASSVPGTILRVGKQMAFLHLARSVEDCEWPMGYPEFPFGATDSFGIVGESEAAWRVRQAIAFIGPRSGHVLIHGASGVGKELVAQAIHAMSSRSKRKIVSRNAATIPESLTDAEFFGSAKNYPNAGMPERLGLVGEAHESTLFLDEFAELPLAQQTHLLRVLDAGEYQRLGESRSRQTDLRLIAATNRPLETIRPDVLARFPFRIELAGLQERLDDVPLIARHILRRIAHFDIDIASRPFFLKANDGSVEPRLSWTLLESLLARPYPTNVRELENALWESITVSQGKELAAHQHSPAPSSVPTCAPSTDANGPAMQGNSLACRDAIASHHGVEPAQIQACLDEHNGVLEHAWRALGLKNRYELARLIAKYGLEVRHRPGLGPRRSPPK